MPGFDRTGPWGQGSRTGWGRGLCAGAGVPGSGAFGGFGRGRGRGFWGRCFGWGFMGRMGRWWAGGPPAYAPFSAADEAELLRNQVDAARAEIAAMEARLAELKKEE